MADATDKMREALELAEAALMGRNMNMTVVRRKIREALAQQPAQGEAAPHDWRDVGINGYQCAACGAMRFGDDGPCSAAPPVPSVPDAMSSSPHHGEYSSGYVNGWNACRAAMLASGGKASVPSVEQPTSSIRDAGPAAFGGRKTRRE